MKTGRAIILSVVGTFIALLIAGNIAGATNKYIGWIVMIVVVSLVIPILDMIFRR